MWVTPLLPLAARPAMAIPPAKGLSLDETCAEAYAELCKAALILSPATTANSVGLRLDPRHQCLPRIEVSTEVG